MVGFYLNEKCNLLEFMAKFKLQSSFIFNKKIAKGFIKTKFYEAQAKNQKMSEYIDLEKVRLSTPKWEVISDLIKYYKDLGSSSPSSTGKILLGIYNKNKRKALSEKNRVISHDLNFNLLNVVSKPETLMLAYRMIKGNKGILTEASTLSKEEFNNLNDIQKQFYTKSLTLPERISFHDFLLAGSLLKKGLYPWGTSLRIYVPKPGNPEKMRPLTIPPFMDKVVQKAINLVLEAIYEPYFEKMNRSFGFRPNKGTLDAITAILSTSTTGMKTAIEGDIEAAYDTVKKQNIINILGKTIKDKKFLKLIESRLNYSFVEKETKERISPVDGIPQGGIDSPLLWNIYMHELDKFIHTDIQNLVEKFNKSVDNKRVYNKSYLSARSFTRKMIRYKVKAQKVLQELPFDKNNLKVKESRKNLFEIIKKVRLSNHHKNRTSTSTYNKKILRIFYVRYADDWILLTNGGIEIAKVIKEKIAKFLDEILGLKLSEKKSLITDITKTPAKFLGFEIRANARGPLRRLPVNDKKSKKKFTLCKKSCATLWCQPDRQRLINRFHMKGLCDKNGFPSSLSWLSCLEPQIIIERTNAVIRGLANFYLPAIRNRAKIHRWIYILRFSCLKTLAQKYRGSIKSIFKRFGYNMFNKSDQTIRMKVTQKYGNKTFFKNYTLLTYKDLVNEGNYLKQKDNLLKIFWEREKGIIGNYAFTGIMPKITNEDFLEKITWVSWRTSAAFDMPCAYCGTFDSVHMHHLKHIRKRAYSLIPAPEKFTQILALRNRKQIPLCETHHLLFVHSGKYDGPRLLKLAPVRQKLMDNRIIHLESFIKPGALYHGKNLEEKGWEPYK